MRRGWVLTASLCAGLVLVTATVWGLLRPEPLPDRAPDVPEVSKVDTGRVMDLEHLTEADLRFLESVLDGEVAEGRVSATRALVEAGDVRGAPLLFDRAVDGQPDDLLYCLGGLEILRMQRFETATRVLVLASQGPLSPDCAAEVDERLSVLARDQGGLILLADAPEPQVRAWVTYKLNLDLPPTHGAIAALAQDTDKDVRRAAWLAINAHGKRLSQPELLAWEQREPDPNLRSLVREVIASW